MTSHLEFIIQLYPLKYVIPDLKAILFRAFYKNACSNDTRKRPARENDPVCRGIENERIQEIAAKFKELTEQIRSGDKYDTLCPNAGNIERILQALMRYQVYGQTKGALRWYT